MNKNIFTIIFLSFITIVCIGQTHLTIGEGSNHTIVLHQEHEYNISLKKGEFALINIIQKGIDLTIESYTPNNELIEKFDSQNGSVGYEVVFLDAKIDGDYSLKVLPLGENKKQKGGKYHIQLISVEKDIRNHLDKVMQTINEGNHIPGFQVSILNQEKVLYSNAQGYANLKEQIPYTQNTIQQIESISKTFIALAVMKLVEEGKLDLDADINQYLPFKVENPHARNSPITLRHLATHTASINDGKKYNKAYTILDKDLIENNNYPKHLKKEIKQVRKNQLISLEEFLRNFFTKKGKFYSKKNFFKKPSGKEWYYSNIGASLAAYIVEEVSGQPYDDYVMENIIVPLNMKQTTWGIESRNNPLLALKYDEFKNELPRTKGATYPEGGIYSSSLDLNLYLMHWMNGFTNGSNILKATSYQEIMSIQYEQRTGRFKGVKNGLFWWQFNNNRMGHNGGSAGSATNMFFYPDLNIGYTSFENVVRGTSDEANVRSGLIKKALDRYCGYFPNTL